METPEIGSLTAHSPQESQFVGSSSGVFFVKTVRQAFGSSSEFPPPEDTLIGCEPTHGSSQETPVVQWEYDPSIACVLGQPPPQNLAKDLMMVYFKVWHPLFPFLHGPTFLHAMESLYSRKNQPQPSESSEKHNTPWTTIFQCIFNLAALIRPDLQLPPECRIQPPISASMHSLLSPLTARHDLLSLQALLASQLYLVATMSLRTASTIGGCMLRSMLHAGLHRCPFRYSELSTSSQHRHLRKRIFWSAYALDRYLSQALGLPLGVQDSDIDVCPPGSPERHKPLQHLPLTSPNTATFQFSQPGTEPEQEPPSDQSRKEAPFASYVQSGKLTGEALELFHKSITVRSISHTSMLVLTTSVHKWWNSLDLPNPPQSSSSDHITSSIDESNLSFNYTPFFTIAYHHLLLLLSRPALSLPQSTPLFASALQSCISAARHILLALKAQYTQTTSLFWPGFLSAAWMAGLVLAFACQLGQYALVKGCSEISSCLGFLGIMARQNGWDTARHCQRALGVLLRAVSSPSNTSTSNNGSGPGPGATVNANANLNNINANTATSATATPGTTATSRPEDSGLRKKRRVEDSSAYQGALDPFGVDAGSVEDSLDRPPGIAGLSAQPGFDIGGTWDQPVDTELDMNMVDLLQEGNFDSLMDLFGQQYPTF